MNWSEAIAELRRRGLTISVAESLTGGRLADALVSVPGTSDVFKGGVVTYASESKAKILGVDAALLGAGGPVQAGVATQMATGAAALFTSDVALSTTGVAGPGPADGKPAGNVFVGLHANGEERWEELHLQGDRCAVRDGSVEAALELLTRWLEDEAWPRA